MPALTPMMLEEVSRFNELCQSLSTEGVPIDLVPTCRALEADIVCESILAIFYAI